MSLLKSRETGSQINKVILHRMKPSVYPETKNQTC